MAKADWDKRAQQNRQKRAQNKANQWNKGKLNRTQRNYVAGDLKASASDRAYGYRKNKQTEQKYFQTSFTGGRSKSNYAKLQRGENPYEAKYFYDGVPRTVEGGTRADGSKYKSFTSRKRYLTNDEKEAYKQTGDINTKKWKKNYKYQLLDGVDSDGKNFRSNLNLTNADGSIKWDGMNVARNRVKAGGSKWNYVGGFLKDTVGDFIFDSAKVADRYFGSALQGTLGVAETIKGLTDVTAGVGSLSKVNFRQGLDNIKSSIEESNKTGWAKSSSDTLREANTRYDNKVYEHLLKTKGQASADAYMESVKKAEPFSKVLEGVAGFGIDVLNPLDMTERIKGATKIAKNNAIKSAKEIVTGTGSQAVAFLPKSSQELYEVGLKHKDMLERMKAYKKYLQEEYIPKFGNKIDDEKAWKLFENSSQAEEYAHNFGYMANNIDQTINHSLDSGFNRAMGKAEEVKEVVKSNPATQNLGRFLDELKPVEVESTNEVFEQTYKGFLNKNGKVKEGQLFEMLDNIDDDFSYGMLDWLEKNDPKTYQKYVGDIADNVDDHVNVLIEQGSKVNESYLTNPTKKAKSEIFEAIKNKVDKLNDNYNKNALERMMKRGEYVAPKRESYGTLKQQFSDFANNVKEQVIKGDRTFYNKVNEVVSKIDIDKLAKDDGYKMQVIELLNKELFGADFIRQNIKKGSLKSFVEHLDDIRAYNVAKESGQFTFKPHGNYSGTKNGIHYMTNRNGKPNPIELNSSLFAPSLLDDMFDEKMSFVDSLVGVKHKSELTKPFEELKTLAKQEGFKMLDAKDRKLLSDIADGKASNSAKIHLDEKMLNLGLSKLSDEQQRLYKSLEHRLNVRDSAYAEIKNMEFADFENYKKNFKGERSVLDDMYYKSIENSDKKSSEILNAIEDNRKAKFETTDIDYNNVGEVEINKKAKRKGLDNKSLNKGHEFKREMQETKRIGEYHEKAIKFAKEKGLDLPEVTKAKVKLAKNQTLGSLPPVKKNLEGLKKLIKKEVEEMYTNPKSYAENKAMYDAIKRDFIKGLRSYGVPDNAYFEKAKNLKKLEEEVFKKNLNKKVDSLLDNYKPSGGKGSKELKMNLQLLARKVDEMFDGLGKADIDTLSKTVEDAKNVSWSPLEELTKSFKGDKRAIDFALSKYDDRSTEKILEDIFYSDVDPESRNMLALYAQLEKRGVDFSKVLEENTKRFKKAPSTLQMYAEYYEKRDPKFVNPLKANKTPLDKIVDDMDMNAENPFSSIKDGVDEILDEGVADKKVRRKKTQKEIDQINATLERYNKPTPLDKIAPSDKKRLPRISELMEQGMIKEEAIKLIEKMKKGEVDIPSADVVTKPDRRGGVNTTTKANVNELRKVISDIGYGVSKESQLKPGEFINESTGEIEKVTDYILNKKGTNTHPDIYDVVDELENVKPEDIMKPRTFKPNEGKKEYPSENPFKFAKEGDEINIPKERIVNSLTGEVEDLSKYVLNKKGTNTHPDIYDVVDELEDVKPEDIMKPRTFKPDEGRKPYPSENPFKFAKEGESIELPKNKYVNSLTGEVEDLSKYVLNNSTNTHPDIYDVVDELENVKPEDIMKPRTFKPNEGKKEYPSENPFKFSKEGENIELPKNKYVNQFTGEIEDMKKYRLDGGDIKNSNPNVYDNVDDVVEQMNKLEHFEKYLSGDNSKTLADELDKVGANFEQPTKAPSKEIQKLIDYVEEEKLFSDFNESIGNDVPSFEKFKRWFNDGSKVAYNDNKVYDLYKRWLNSWKKGLTIYNPGWHVKNFFQNKGQSYLGIGVDAFKSQKNAREMFKNMKGLENSAKGILQKNGTYYSPSELTNIAKRSGVINGFNDLVKESRGLIPPLETAIDNSALMKKLSMSEETARLHHFLTKIERGATPEEAVKSVNKYLFDYSKQNKFDRFMSDFVDPFWTYHKNSAKLVSETGITSPIRTSNILRGTRGLEHGLDEKDKANEQKRDLQAPFGHFVDKKNKDRYTYQYDMDLFPSLEEFAPIEKDDVMSKLNPLIKLAIQHKDGEGNFGNKVVDKKEADWGEVTKDERKLEILKEVNPFMNPLVKAYYKSKEHQEKADKGKQSQETSDKQILMDWLEYILGNKGNYYRDVR